jgi:hypothetical protein
VQLDWVAVEAERRLVEDTAERGRNDSEATAALTILAGALDLADARTRAAIIPWCGAHRALVDECATYLDQLMLKLAFVATTPGNG